MAENSQEKPDFFNALPEEILMMIVSLIPLKEAARTTILSSSWKSLWTPLEVSLDITSDDQAKTREAMNQIIISSFLTTFDTPQKLNLFLQDPKETLFKAIKGVDQQLHISFSEEKKEQEACFGLSIELPLLDHHHFCSLKTLHLRSINGHACNFLSALFSGCRILETLSVEKCSGLQNISIKAHGFLKNFTVLDCEQIASITVSSAPNLKSFLYQGILPNIQLKDTLKLSNVVLNMNGGLGQNEFDCEDVVSLLASLKGVEILALSGWLLEWSCKGGVIFDKLEYKFNKLKQFSWLGSSIDKPKRDSLACFLNITPYLEKLFIEIDEKWSKNNMQSPIFHRYWHEPHLWTDFATVKCNASQLKHLRIVEFLGFKISDNDEILSSLMDLLLKKAIVLKKMTVISPENNRSWWVDKIPRSHSKKLSSRSYNYSKRPVILWSKKECCFLLTEEDR